jgi:hypothetical protein
MPPPANSSLIKGALIAYDSPVIGAVPNLIAFQFNPDELSRTLEQRGFQGNQQTGSRTVEARRRVKGPPSESIDLTLRLDASSLDRSLLNVDAVAAGVQPAISALEMLLYPKEGIESSVGKQIPSPGKVQISYAEKEVPLLLFVWGTRVLPVQLTSFSVTEQAFDRRLNPVRAEVSVTLQVLTPDQLSDGIGKDAYRATHAQRQRWTQLNLLGSARNIGSAAGL